MKYAVLLGDGMADHPVPELGGRTPLQTAKKPDMDMLAREGVTGMVRTIPPGMPTGSDTANMAVFGYDPKEYYTGRSSIEAISMGIELKDDDLAFRCNLVTLSGSGAYEEKTMIDYSSDEIETEDAAVMITELDAHLSQKGIKFFPGKSYRHCMVWNMGIRGMALTPPHDILEKKTGKYLPDGDGSSLFIKMMKESFEFLSGHRINAKRAAKGLRPANSIWLWGEGSRLKLPSFKETYRLKGSVISAVDLVKGIGIASGMKSVDVKGATGNISTNFRGKAEAALQELRDGSDFVYIHIEAPDECGHRHEVENKVRSVELIDSQVLRPLIEGLEKLGGGYRIMLLPDHQTPLELRTHTGDPVPFVIYDSRGREAAMEDFLQAATAPDSVVKCSVMQEDSIMPNDQEDSTTPNDQETPRKGTGPAGAAAPDTHAGGTGIGLGLPSAGHRTVPCPIPCLTGAPAYDEVSAVSTGLMIEKGHALMGIFTGRTIHS
ncbi:MAG: cofactor-independent phosphoglycerate mutase [Eubacteriales bacterium]|nr:cofactor-independent phosphoglycerate mutase [Eubacteriales bacterium]